MIGKKHIIDGKIIFAACDKDLLNKKIEHEDIIIEINESFFGNTELTDKEIVQAIEECDSANFFGKRVCNILITNNLLLNEHLIYLGDVPHAQIYKL
jgi:hypothetical protein